MIGDSITDGQYPFVQEILTNVTDSHLIPINGGRTSEGVLCVSMWTKDPERWDIISYNFGAWNIGSADCNASKTANGSYVDPALEQYISQLVNITQQLQRTKAAKNNKLIFVLTTPSPQIPECCDDPSSTTPGSLGTHTCVKVGVHTHLYSCT
jgi:hypothetical protein